jgi:L-asparaginase
LESNRLKIKIFSVGGTIDKIYFDQKSVYEIGEPQVITILREANTSLEFECESVLKKDSLDMTDEDRLFVDKKIRSEPCNRIIVTHGTDTMIETAKALMPNTDKTIVLTGAIEPARFKSSDASFNIGGAIVAVQTLPGGVYIVMNGQVFHPEQVRKNHDLNRFESLE